MYCACLAIVYLLIHCLSVCTYACVLMCVYYSNCITIMSNICDSTDTSTCTYLYLMVNYIKLCIVCVVVVVCIIIIQELYVIPHTEPCCCCRPTPP